MELRVVEKGEHFSIYAVVKETGKCEVLDFLQAQEKDNYDNCITFLRLTERMVNVGKIQNKEQFRKVEGTKFFEFKPGNIRVLCFFDAGRIIICTHGFIKKRQKTPRKEIKKAEQIRDEYFLAKRNDKLTF